MNIYGHEVELTMPDANEVVTDVIVLARAVWYADDGHAQDSLLMTSTRTTTGMVASGMLAFALDMPEEDDE